MRLPPSWVLSLFLVTACGSSADTDVSSSDGDDDGATTVGVGGTASNGGFGGDGVVVGSGGAGGDTTVGAGGDASVGVGGNVGAGGSGGVGGNVGVGGSGGFGGSGNTGGFGGSGNTGGFGGSGNTGGFGGFGGFGGSANTGGMGGMGNGSCVANATVDVPVAHIQLDVTLNGAAIDNTNTGDLDEGAILLRDPITGDTIDLQGVWDDTNDVSFAPYDLTIVAGFYDVYYRVVDDGPNWPSNTDTLLIRDLDLTTSGNVTVNIPAVDVQLDVTLSNVVLSAANTGDLDEGAVVLRDPDTGEAIDLQGVWDDTFDVPFPPYNLRLIAQNYDLYYRVVDDGPNWPSNTNALVQTGVDLSVGGAVVVDVPSVDVALDVTLNGQPITGANTGDLDEGAIVLIDPDTADAIDLQGVWDDTNDVSFAPYTLQLIGKTYDVRYRVVDDGPNWPSNTNALLEQNVDLSGGGNVTVDVPAVDISLDITLNGAALDGTNTGDLDEGALILRDAETLDEIDLQGVWDDTNDVPFAPYVLRLVGKHYDVYYRVVDDGPSWPSNTNALLETDLDLTTSGTVTVDVPAVDVSLDVTFNGAAIDGTNTGDLDEGAIILRDSGTGDEIDLQGVWDDTNDVSFAPYALRLIAKSYEVFYRVVDDGPNWPSNTDARLLAALNLAGGGNVTVDVPSADVCLDVTLGGAAISAANTGDLDEGKIILRDPVTGDAIDLQGVWNDTLDVPFTPYELQLVPQTYEIRYGVVDDGPMWPSNNDAALADLQVN